MATINDLRKGSFLQAPPGWQARQREQDPSDARDDMDAQVIAAGGKIERQTLTSNAIGAGRMVRDQTEVTWYVLPGSAFNGSDS